MKSIITKLQFNIKTLLSDKKDKYNLMKTAMKNDNVYFFRYLYKHKAIHKYISRAYKRKYVLYAKIENHTDTLKWLQSIRPGTNIPTNLVFDLSECKHKCESNKCFY